MLEDIFNDAAAGKAAEEAVEQAEALFMQCRIQEADALLSRQLMETPKAACVLDEAIKIKCIRYCYSEALRLAETWKAVTGEEYSNIGVLNTAEEYHAADAPEMADAVYGYLARQARGIRIKSASNGLCGGRFVNYLTVAASDARVKALNEGIAACLREQLGIEEPGIVVINDSETQSLDINAKLRQLEKKDFDVDTFIDCYREMLEENGIDPDSIEVMETLNQILDIMVRRIVNDESLDPSMLAGLL